MNDEPIIPNQKKRVPYNKIIQIVIRGKAPEPKDKEKFGSEQYLPIGLFEYIQNICSKYKEMFERDGLMIFVEVSMKDIKE
jgi:hypothetical protein